MSVEFEFPDGVRLARLEEIPGPEPLRAATWARVQAARIAPGYTLVASDDSRFSRYAEINVNASQIWMVFRDLCQALLGPVATMVASLIDEEPVTIGSTDTGSIVAILENHKYQLSNDGFLQFGLLCNEGGMLTEIFVAPTKHFKVWLNDEALFLAAMDEHGLQRHDRLEFIDQFPRTTVALTGEPSVIRDHTVMLDYLKEAIGGRMALKAN
jgi:hypothetical protein